jgi:hypothetical protein
MEILRFDDPPRMKRGQDLVSRWIHDALAARGAIRS